MRCPHCRTETLSQTTLADGPFAMHCSSCDGHWVGLDAYQQWQSTGPAPQLTAAAPQSKSTDSREAKLCPECGRLLIRFKVHPDVPFRLEHCGGCGGVWFDAGEWAAMHSRDLHRDITHFFTQAWQQELRRLELRRHLETQYLERFGAQDFERLRDTWTWLTEHARRSEMLAFLSSDDPYG